MTLFVLTCINEELEIVNQRIFTNFLEASHTMQDEFGRERSAMLADNGEEYVVQDDMFAMSATLVYGDQPYQYEWVIRKIEA